MVLSALHHRKRGMMGHTRPRDRANEILVNKDVFFLVSLFADAWKRVPKMMVKTQFFQLISAGWSSIIGFSVFATFYVLEKGSLKILGRTFEIGTGDFVVVVMFILLGLALCAQSVFFYLENTTLNRLCRIYEERNVERAIARIRNIRVRDIASLPGRLDRATALRAMQMDARLTANTQRLLQRVPVPIVMMVFGIGMLGFLDPYALIAVFLFTLAASVPFFVLSQRAREISQDFDTSAARLTDTKRGWLDRIIMESGHGSEEYSEAHIRELLSHTSMREFMSLFEARFNILSQSSAIGGLISSVTVAIVTAIFAWQAVNGHMAWSFVILHFVSLQYIFRAVSRVTSLAVSANRFRTQIQRYFEFVSNNTLPSTDSASALVDTESGSLLNPVAVPITREDGGSDTFTIEAGSRTFVVGNANMDRFEIYRLVLALGYQDNPKLRFLDRPHFVTFPKIDNINAATEFDDIFRSQIREVLGADHDSGSEAARFVGLVLREASLSLGVLFIDQRGIVLLEPDQASRLFALLQNLHIFIYAARSIPPSRTWDIATALIFDGMHIRSILDVDTVIKNQEDQSQPTKAGLSGMAVIEDDTLSNADMDI